MKDPQDVEARTALGLATDLGGYAIMLGGTNGAHLTSFSLVDILSHGRACAIMNPYYTVFFAPAVEEPLRLVGNIFKKAGYTSADIDSLQGRELGVAVAEAMMTLSRKIGFPTTLSEVKGFTEGHIERALAAAKDPAAEDEAGEHAGTDDRRDGGRVHGSHPSGGPGRRSQRNQERPRDRFVAVQAAIPGRRS